MMILVKKLFINNHSQLRSGWKILIALSTSYLFTIILSKLVQFTDQTLLENKLINLLLVYVQFLSMIVIVIALWKIFDKRPIKDIGLTSPIVHHKDLLFGLGLGVASITMVFIVLLLTGQVVVVNRFLNPNISSTLISDFILFIFVAINEELFLRGYCMTVLKQTRSIPVMVILSSVIFSLMHSMNPNINLIGFINIFLVGVLFAYMFLKRGNLWMPIGYHITWNYFQGNIFGFQVSGLGLNGMYQLHLTTENFVNGGRFGPEGGLITTIVLLLGFIAIWKLHTNTKIHKNHMIKRGYINE